MVTSYESVSIKNSARTYRYLPRLLELLACEKEILTPRPWAGTLGISSIYFSTTKQRGVLNVLRRSERSLNRLHCDDVREGAQHVMKIIA